MAVTPGSIVPVVTTAAAAVISNACKVHWITASNGHASEITAVELNDSTDDSGTDRWACYLSDNAAGNNTVSMSFDPPIEFVNGIYLDLTNATTVAVTIGIEG